MYRVLIAYKLKNTFYMNIYEIVQILICAQKL